MEGTHYEREWQQSAIAPALIALNLKILEYNEIAQWYFQYLPNSARRNDGRIRDGYLKVYSEPLKGGWGVEGYDPTDIESEPELRCFKPDFPRTNKDGKIIKYDIPKNAQHHPILVRVSYGIASIVCRSAGINFLEQTLKYAPEELETGVEDNAECKWFWRMIQDNPSIPISITEGAKKALALLSRGRCALAVTSITTWRESKGSHKVHPWLANFASRRRIYLTFDQDTKPQTRQAVDRQCLKLGTALIKAGAINVKRIGWSGTAKGIDDFIFNLTHKYGDRCCQKILRKCYENARNYRNFKSSNCFPGTIKRVNQRYLKPEDLKEAANYKIVAVKSAKGTNKTGILSDLVSLDRREGIPTINVTLLERLARELGIRLGMPYRTEQGTISLRNALGYSLCFDSFSPDNSIPFHPEQWTDAGIALDEFTQGIHHLAFGTTELKKYRKLIVATLGQKLADCWNYNRPIRLLDADANPESIELIYDLIQLYSDRPITRDELEAQTFVLINEFRPSKGDLYFYDEPSPKQIRANLITKLKNRETLLILTSSQKPRSSDSTTNLEKLAQKYYKHHEILRIDRVTTGNRSHPAFNISGEHLSNLIKSGKYKVIIASPTICTGISIDGVEGCFDAVFSFQAGNLTLNSIRQQLVRLRDFAVPRHLWCPKTGKNFVGSRSTNPLELLTDQKREAQIGLKLLGVREAEKLIESNICPLTKHWAIMGAKVNSDNYRYREILAYQLQDEGWNVIHRFPDDDSQQLQQIWHERSQIKCQAVAEKHHNISSAKDITNDEAEKLEKAASLTETQQAQLEKHTLKQKYLVEEVTPSLIEADAKKLAPALWLRFWLTQGREFLVQSDRTMLEQTCQLNRGQFFIPDFNSKSNIVKVQLLSMLNLERFEQLDTEWSNKSKELLELKEFVFQDVVRFNQVLRCGIAQSDSAIAVLQKIFKTIGKKLPCLRNERDGDKRLRIYGAAVSRFELDSIESQILTSWYSKCASKYGEEKNQRGYCGAA